MDCKTVDLKPLPAEFASWLLLASATECVVRKQRGLLIIYPKKDNNPVTQQALRSHAATLSERLLGFPDEMSKIFFQDSEIVDGFYRLMVSKDNPNLLGLVPLHSTTR
jgi:hypothetical protein